MSRKAGNITYFDFLNSTDDKHLEIVSYLNIVPEFQRNYVWKPAQIKDLIESIVDNESNYFIGNIVVIKKSNARSSVVDGQQRLVTLSLIAYILEKQVENIDVKSKLKKLFVTDDSNLRLEFTKDNLQETYSSLLNDEDIDINGITETQKKITDAFNTIERQLISIVDKENFANKLLSLEFIVIAPSTEEDAYQLFEGLNSTGLSLSAVELTKNAILGKVKNLDETKLDEASTLWDEIEKRFEDSGNISLFNKFLRHQWFSEDGYVSGSGLYKKIKDAKINDVEDIDQVIDYLKILSCESKYYLLYRKSSLAKADLDARMPINAWKKVIEVVFNLERLGVDQVYSVILALHKYGVKNSDYFVEDRFSKHLEKIFGFIVIAKYTKLSPSSFERKFAAVSKDIQNKNYGDFKTRMNTFFNELAALVVDSKESFSKRFAENVDTSATSREVVRCFLDEYLRVAGEGSDTPPCIEHIIPENNLSEWSNVDETIIPFIGQIGNLTLLTEELNNDAGHKNFDDKYNVAYINSRYTVNNRINSEWGEVFKGDDPKLNAITVRGELIGAIIFDKYLSNID